MRITSLHKTFTCEHFESTPLREVRAECGVLQVLQVLNLPRDEGPNLREDSSHGQVGLPLATGLLGQGLQELQELLSVLTS